MKPIKKPKTVDEYLELDLRKCDVIPTKAFMKDICNQINRLKTLEQNMTLRAMKKKIRKGVEK